MRPGPVALRLALCAALLCSGLVSPATGQTGTGTGAGAGTGDRIDPATSTIEIQLEADGDARFEVSTSFRLDSEADAAAFDSLASAFTANGSRIGFSVTPFRTAAARAGDATGRPMTVERVRRVVNRSNGSDGPTGTLALRFVWTDFARVDGDRLYVDDAFNATDDLWLPRLDEDQRLVIRAPPDYLVETAPFPVRAGAISIAGPRAFASGAFDFTFRRVNPASTATTTTANGTDTSPSPSPSRASTVDEQRGDLLPLLGGVVVALAAVGLGLYAASRRERDGEGPAEPPSDGSGSPGSGSGSESGSDSDSGPTDGEDGGGTDAPPADADGSAPADAGPGAGTVDETLLSDEERVERLLRSNGGRMKQADIVDETGWSNAKVSQLLSSMAEDDRVDKLRLGRENLISLPGANGGADGEDGEDGPDPR